MIFIKYYKFITILVVILLVIRFIISKFNIYNHRNSEIEHLVHNILFYSDNIIILRQ